MSDRLATVVSPAEFEHPLFQAFTKAFRAGDFFAAHEHLEEFWILSGRPRSGTIRGLVQLAVACEHYRRGNAVGARGVLTRALKNLDEGDPLTRAAVGPFERILRDEVAGPLPPPGPNFPR